MPKETFFRLRDEKQDSIMRSAINEFAEHGFERAKICDIAKNANVATGSIYQYFADKEELFMYCAQWAFDCFMKKIDFRPDITNMDIFEYYDERLANPNILNEEREVVRFMQELMRHPDMMRPSIHEIYKKSEEQILRLIDNTKNKGLIRTDISSEILLEYFVAVTERFKLYWMTKYEDLTQMPPDEMREKVNIMLELLKHGLKGDQANV
ncbi:MAG: TetR/AcrR family transcriptional regulator [Defluviitaleaceae bacterium]|nr:TetR/AcrR family transcriptional regulator [Defluviitaleaceae bacterium]